MCGILGILPATCSRQGFEEALATIHHRGPDGYGVWANESLTVMLGHRRLSIMDVSDNGKQPMVLNERYVVTFNGEIYNFEEVRHKLRQFGFSFRTGSDTEVLLAAYAHWGVKCLEQFNGMWAFGIWDEYTHTLFLARDRFGVKPLYYAQIGSQLVFGSEMKALLPFLPDKNASSHFQWCHQHQHDYEGTDKTLVEGIRRFPAGHYALYSPAKQQVQPIRYWDTLQGVHSNQQPYAVQVEEFKALFEDACRLRMMADVPVATALSGGIDSSVIAASLNNIAKQHTDPSGRNEFKVFAASFPDAKELDEIEYAQAVAQHLQLPLTTLPIASSFSFNSLTTAIWKFEELYETTPLPMMGLYQGMANQGYKVSIDGHAGDELFAGYGHAVFNIVKDEPFNRTLIRQLIETYKAMYAPQSTANLLHLIDAFGGRKNLVSYYIKRLFKASDKAVPSLDHFNNYLFEIFHRTILPTLLRNYDRYSMAAGVEVRMPFMDYRLVQYAFSIGWQAKIREGYTKAIVRDAFGGALPSKVIRRRQKIGFSSPMNKWFEGPWKIAALDILHSQSFLESGLYPQAKQVQTELVGLLSKKELTFREGFHIWNGLQPYLWENYFLKEASKVSVA